MTQLLKQGLIITVVGMGLVFAALALLWGVMAAMHRLFPPGEKPFAPLWQRWRGRAAAPAEEGIAPAPIVEDGAGLSEAELAAVMAALALCWEEAATEAAIGRLSPPELTRWVAVGRSRQLRSWTPRR